MQFIGAYGPGVSYSTGDVVVVGGIVYVSTQDHNQGVTPAINVNGWFALAQLPTGQNY